MEIKTNVCGDDQMACFMNATLQSGGCTNVEFSIATFVEVPPILQDAPQEVIAEWLRKEVLGPIEKKDSRITFEVEIGPAEEGTPGNEE